MIKLILKIFINTFNLLGGAFIKYTQMESAKIYPMHYPSHKNLGEIKSDQSEGEGEGLFTMMLMSLNELFGG